jgi:tRNA-5-taurinomethyluridine 2-sulfurtransferase
MKIAMLVSGGVDSAVSLALLKSQGHTVEAFYLKIWLEDELSHLSECPWEDDLSYVQAICAQFDTPLHIVNLQKEYFAKVVEYCVKQVEAGLTPNPDMLCNSLIKFGVFFEYIDQSFDAVATGHYAQTKKIDGKTYLCRVKDQIKDQTYFLALLNQTQIARALFPIAHLTKTQVRSLAHSFNLPNAQRKDSQGICFLGKLKYNEFLASYLQPKQGPLVDIHTNQVVGTHNGYYFHTIGQRKGTGLGHGPWYVVKKDKTTNTVYISNKPPTVEKKTFIVDQLHWIATKPESNTLKVKLRHGEQVYRCTVEYVSETKAKVSLHGMNAWIAPGQYAVFYDDFICYGCAIVSDEQDMNE